VVLEANVDSRVSAVQVRGVPQWTVVVPFTDPVTLLTATAVMMRTRRTIPEDQGMFAPSTRPSGLLIESLPAEVTMHGLLLFDQIIPDELRVFARRSFWRRVRSMLIRTGHCIRLDPIRDAARLRCRTLAASSFHEQFLSTAAAGWSTSLV
jgi:hypothetical protein